MSSFTSEVRTLLETDKVFRDEFIEEEAASDIAAAIIELRKRRGLTQKQLAELTGMKQSAISRLENARYSRWSFATIVRIAKALGARIDFRLEAIEDVYRGRTEKAAESARQTAPSPSPAKPVRKQVSAR
jgi:transcriptional regulator with XRE-family HTH domain